ncbi:MAG: class I SAM-dependent methyltransferase [Haliscomenobacteraceae bacterium CHB4]|nr:hypothetical protein [Saprospiraceae bacterium]MCE7923273.1 class I SAM-dependent methyltransferase [Haliscomenobacteraceae bacterium CHB4]
MQIRENLAFFDTVARDYDKSFTGTAVGRLLRERVWALLTRTGGFSRRESTAKAAGTALELNCGTGEDAVWLAKQGYNVLATDISPEMVALTAEKARQAGVGERIRTQTCSFAEVGKLEGPFDLVFSNFGGLNCVPPEELKKLSLDLQKLVAPGGLFVAVAMSRFCWWETLYFLLKIKPREAFRRWSRKPVQARLDEKTTVPTWYYSPVEIRRHFPDFQVKRVLPVGFWLPPSYLNPFFEKRPRLLGLLNFLEKNGAPAWLAPASDHFLICFEKARYRH